MTWSKRKTHSLIWRDIHTALSILQRLLHLICSSSSLVSFICIVQEDQQSLGLIDTGQYSTPSPAFLPVTVFYT